MKSRKRDESEGESLSETVHPFKCVFHVIVVGRCTHQRRDSDSYPIFCNDDHLMTTVVSVSGDSSAKAFYLLLVEVYARQANESMGYF